MQSPAGRYITCSVFLPPVNSTGVPSLISRTVSVDVKHHVYLTRVLMRLNEVFVKSRFTCLNSQSFFVPSILIIINYIYHALIKALSAHMIHINLNTHKKKRKVNILIFLVLSSIFLLLSSFDFEARKEEAPDDLP